MRELYNKVQTELNKLNFNEIWFEFYELEFALYNKQRVFLADQEIACDNRFFGNTNIEFEGKHLAIWFVEDASKENPMILAANIVHEMFHGFQKIKNETRYANEFEGLKYPNDLMNHQIKYLEAQKIVDTITSEKELYKHELLEEIISLRKTRIKLYGNQINYEFQIETFEGIAEYCGLKALGQLSKDLFYQRLKHYQEILSDKRLLFDVRKYSYYTGAMLMLLVDQLDIKISREITNQKLTIFHQLLKSVDTKDFDYKLDEDIKNYYLQVKHEKESQFDNFFKNEVEKVVGDYLIAGFDPMNMIKKDKQLLHNHIIILENKNSEKIHLDGPVITEIKDDIINQVKTYYKIKQVKK